MPDTNNLRDFARQELKKHNIPEREDLYDPETNRTIPSVTTGILPYYRAAQVAELKAKSRSTGGYTAEGTPQRTGDSSGKHLGLSELRALKSHGADAVLSDLKLIHSSRNNDFWNKVKSGQTPSIPDTPEVYQKFRDMITAAGVNLREDREGDHIYAMTNQNARDITGNRKIQKPATYDLKGRPIQGGLFSPDNTAGKFGYIELPEPMLNPIMENPVRKILGLTQQEFREVIRGERTPGLQERLKSLDINTEMQRAKKDMSARSGDKRDRAYTKYQYLSAMKENNTRPEDFMLDRVPVLPSEWRQITEMKNKATIVPDPNRMYRDLMFRIDDYRDSKDYPELVPEAREQLYDSFKSTIGTTQPQSPRMKQDNVRGILSQFLSKGSPKSSMIQRRIIGSDIDLYGLGVITPDPRLDMDSAGVPEELAWKVYEPFTIRSLVKSGLSPRKATEEVEARTTRAKNALRQSVESRPALLNRAPTLHKYGIQAFKGKMVPGSAIRMNPYVLRGFNADMDGDTMSVTTPATSEAVQNAWDTMLPSKNLLSPGGKPAYTPDSEMIQGLYLMTKPPENNPPIRTDKQNASITAKKAYSKYGAQIDDPVIGADPEKIRGSTDK